MQNIFARIISELSEEKKEKMMINTVKIIRYKINPKPHSMDILYGNFDEATYEWSR